jgi:hypothetical protein
MADSLTTWLFIGIVAGLVGGIAIIVWRNGSQSGLSRASAGSLMTGTLLVMILWLATMAILARDGFFDALMAGFPPPMALALLPPWITIIGCILLPSLRRFLTLTPMAILIGYQVFRVGVEYVLWTLHQQGLMPPAMTFEGQNIDGLVGLTAPLAALLVLRPGSLSRRVAVIWNIAGLLILFNTIRVAMQSVPGVFYNPAIEPANTIVSQFPFIWLPAFVVPVALLGHLLALAKVLPEIIAVAGQARSPGNRRQWSD